MKPRTLTNTQIDQDLVAKKYAYVIPYSLDPNGQASVLTAQKKVICYQAKENLESGVGWENLKTNLTKPKPNFTECKETHFNGLFFAGGGKATCFGGRVNTHKGESLKIAAARELLEETGVMAHLDPPSIINLIQEITDNLELLYNSHNFPGTYYSLDLNRCRELNKILTPEYIESENKQIQAHEVECKSKSLFERKEEKYSKKVSEMHHLDWIKLTDLIAYLNTNGYSGEMNRYIDSEYKYGAEFLVGKLYSKNQKEYEKLLKPLRNYINDRLRDEPVGANVEAAKVLVSKLQPEKTMDSKEEIEANNLTSSSKWALSRNARLFSPVQQPPLTEIKDDQEKINSTTKNK